MRGKWESAIVDRTITRPDGTCNPITDGLTGGDPKVGDTWLHLKGTEHCMNRESARTLERRDKKQFVPGIDLPHV